MIRFLKHCLPTANRGAHTDPLEPPPPPPLVSAMPAATYSAQQTPRAPRVPAILLPPAPSSALRADRPDNRRAAAELNLDLPAADFVPPDMEAMVRADLMTGSRSRVALVDLHLAAKGLQKNPASVLMAKAELRNAARAVFSPWRVVGELVQNGVDAQSTAPVGENGAGFLSVFGLFADHDDVQLTCVIMSSKYKTALGWESYRCQFECIAGDFVATFSQLEQGEDDCQTGTWFELCGKLTDKYCTRVAADLCAAYENYDDLWLIVKNGVLHASEDIGRGGTMRVTVDMTAGTSSGSCRIKDVGPGVTLGVATRHLAVANSGTKPRKHVAATELTTRRPQCDFSGFARFMSGDKVIMRYRLQDGRGVVIAFPAGMPQNGARNDFCLSPGSDAARCIVHNLTAWVDGAVVKLGNAYELDVLWEAFSHWQTQSASRFVATQPFTRHMQQRVSKLLQDHPEIIPWDATAHVSLHSVLTRLAYQMRCSDSTAAEFKFCALSPQLVGHGYGPLERTVEVCFAALRRMQPDRHISRLMQLAADGALIAGTPVFFVKPDLLPHLSYVGRMGLRLPIFAPTTLLDSVSASVEDALRNTARRMIDLWHDATARLEAAHGQSSAAALEAPLIVTGKRPRPTGTDPLPLHTALPAASCDVWERLHKRVAGWCLELPSSHPTRMFVVQTLATSPADMRAAANLMHALASWLLPDDATLSVGTEQVWPPKGASLGSLTDSLNGLLLLHSSVSAPLPHLLRGGTHLTALRAWHAANLQPFRVPQTRSEGERAAQRRIIIAQARLLVPIMQQQQALAEGLSECFAHRVVAESIEPLLRAQGFSTLSAASRSRVKVCLSATLNLYHAYLSIPSAEFSSGTHASDKIPFVTPCSDHDVCDSIDAMLGRLHPDDALFARLLQWQTDHMADRLSRRNRQEDGRGRTFFLPHAAVDTPLSYAAGLGCLLTDVLTACRDHREFVLVAATVAAHSDVTSEIVHLFIGEFVQKRLPRGHVDSFYMSHRKVKTTQGPANALQALTDFKRFSTIFANEKATHLTSVVAVPETQRVRLSQVVAALGHARFQQAMADNDLARTVAFIANTRPANLAHTLTTHQHDTEQAVVPAMLRELLQNAIDAVSAACTRSTAAAQRTVRVALRLAAGVGQTRQLMVDVMDPVGMPLETLITALFVPSVSTKVGAAATGMLGTGTQPWRVARAARAVTPVFCIGR